MYLEGQLLSVVVNLNYVGNASKYSTLQDDGVNDIIDAEEIVKKKRERQRERVREREKKREGRIEGGWEGEIVRKQKREI